MGGRLADRNAVGQLVSPPAIIGGTGQIFYRAVRLSDMQISTATTPFWSGLLIPERRSDGRKITGNGRLADEQNSIRWTRFQ